MVKLSVVNVPEETINAIKQKSIDYSCTMAQVFVDDYGGQKKIIKKDSWIIYNVPKEVKEELKDRAKKMNKPIWVLLKNLLKMKGRKEIERDVRIEVVNDLRKYLKEFRKIS